MQDNTCPERDTTQERSIRESAVVNDQLQRALNSRILVEQAKGVISQTSNVTTNEALDRLRGYARSHRTSLTDMAEAVLSRTLAL